jgi:hypothetical protein
MREFLRSWWIFALRGILASVLAILLFFGQTFTRDDWTGAFSLPFIILALGLYGIGDSLLVLAISTRLPRRHVLVKIALLQGICGLLVGTVLLTVLFTRATLGWFAVLAGFQATVTGTYELWMAVHIKRHTLDEYVTVGAGVSSLIAAACLLFVYDGSSYSITGWLVGYGLLIGAGFFWAAWRLRRALIAHGQKHHHLTA